MTDLQWESKDVLFKLALRTYRSKPSKTNLSNLPLSPDAPVHKAPPTQKINRTPQKPYKNHQIWKLRSTHAINIRRSSDAAFTWERPRRRGQFIKLPLPQRYISLMGRMQASGVKSPAKLAYLRREGVGRGCVRDKGGRLYDGRECGRKYVNVCLYVGSFFFGRCARVCAFVVVVARVYYGTLFEWFRIVLRC